MITTVIFDLDGLLADTEKLHFKSYEDSFSKLGLTISEEVYSEHWIRNGKGIVDFINEHGLDLDLAEIRALKRERYDELVRATAEPMPGAVEALRMLRGRKRLALATSSYRHSATAVLETLGIEEYFECIASKDNVERVKPFPDIFLFVADKLAVDPAECVVLEDAEKGILAAVAAGMHTIAVPNEHTADNDFSKATLILQSLQDLTLEAVSRLG